MALTIETNKLNYLWSFCALVMFSLAMFRTEQMVFADEPSNGSDALFENQIRSMTAPKPLLKPSGDPRYRNNQDGTVTDLKYGLMWKLQDSYQEKKEWTTGKLLNFMLRKRINKNLPVIMTGDCPLVKNC